MDTAIKSNVTAYKRVSNVLETVTPEMARQILSTNINNRNIRPSVVNFYMQQIKRGNWDVNGEAIKISEPQPDYPEGILLDGQHRLEAISRSGVAIETFVCRGLDKNVFTTIDAGKARSHGDYLKIAGVDGNTSRIAASARISMFFGKDGVFKTGGAHSGRGAGSSNKVAPEDIVSYVEKHPGLIESVEKVQDKIGKILPVSIATGCHYIFSIIDMEKADEFFDRLSGGEGLAQGNPILALRNRLISLRGDGRAGEGHRRMLVYYVVHAWNAFMKGRPLQEVKYKNEYEIRIDNFTDLVLSNWG